MSRRNDLIARAAIEYIHALRHAETLEPSSIQGTVAAQSASRALAALRTVAVDADPEMPPHVVSVIRHALGAGRTEKQRASGYRNYFAPAKGDGAVAMAVERGWMEWGAPYRDTRYAHVTEAGARAAGKLALAAWRAHERQR